MAEHEQVTIPQFIHQEFLQDPRIALHVFEGTNLCTCGFCDRPRRQTHEQSIGCRHIRDTFMSDFLSQASDNNKNRQPLTFEQVQAQDQNRVIATHTDNNDDQYEPHPLAPIPD